MRNQISRYPPRPAFAGSVMPAMSDAMHLDAAPAGTPRVQVGLAVILHVLGLQYALEVDHLAALHRTDDLAPLALADVALRAVPARFLLLLVELARPEAVARATHPIQVEHEDEES